MNAAARRAFEFEIKMQTRVALDEWNDFFRITEEHPLEKNPSPTLAEAAELAVLVWKRLQGLLTAAGILASIFFPGDHGDKDRGKQLRRRFGVGLDSPLRNRDMRRLFIHVDEPIDTWAREGPPNPEGPFVMTQWTGPAPKWIDSHHLRILDNTNWRFRLLMGEKEMDLIELVREIGRIHAMANPDIRVSISLPRPPEAHQ